MMSRLALQPLGEVDRRADAVALGVVLRQPHVAFLVDRVVEPLVGHRRDRHADLDRRRDSGTSRSACSSRRRSSPRSPTRVAIDERVPRGESRARPRPDPATTDRRPCRRRPCATPRPSAPACRGCRRWRRCSPAFGERAVEEHAVAAPAIDDRLARRLAVHVEEQRVLPCGIEVGRLHHPAVERHAVADVDREELDRRASARGASFALQRRVVDQRAQRRDGRAGSRGRSTGGASKREYVWNAQRAIRRDVVAVRAAADLRASGARAAAAVEAARDRDTARVAVVRRRDEIDPAGLRVDARRSPMTSAVEPRDQPLVACRRVATR